MLIEVETSKTLLLHCHTVSEFHINCGCGMTFNIEYDMIKGKIVDIDKRYTFPKEIAYVFYRGVYLVISVNTAKWLVLENSQQLEFFKTLEYNTLASALSGTLCDRNDMVEVITQIEAKNFFSTDVKDSHSVSKSLHFYLTNSCNLKCPHCYMNAGRKLDDELSLNEIKKALICFRDASGQEVVFTGGEVTTRSDLYDVVLFANKIGLSVRLLTNGTMWDNNLIAKIAPLVSSVQISVDGYSEESNALIRGKGSFARSLKTAAAFIERQVHTEFAITPIYNSKLEREIDKYADFIRFLEKKFEGCDCSIRLSSDLIDGRDIVVNQDYRTEHARLVLDIYSNLYGQDMTDYPFVSMHKQNNILDNCLFGELTVAANGDVFCCTRVTSVKPIGNIRSDTFDKIVNKANKANRLSNINNLKPCSSCELKYICGGGCRIDFFPMLVKGDINELSSDQIPSRKCSKANKEYYYDLMIKTNRKIFM